MADNRMEKNCLKIMTQQENADENYNVALLQLAENCSKEKAHQGRVLDL